MRFRHFVPAGDEIFPISLLHSQPVARPGFGHGQRVQPLAAAGNGGLPRGGEHCPAGGTHIESKFFHIASCIFIGRQLSAQKAFHPGAECIREPSQQRDIRPAQPAFPL